MANNSPIEWTDATWNPIVGCSIVSPGCTNCYAMKMASRIEAMGNQPRYAGTTRRVNGNAIWTGKLAQAPDSVLLAPLKRKKPTTYFVNSMGDLFHEDCPDEWIDRVFAVMALAPQHTFQVLTKRAARMRDYLTSRNDMGNAALCKAINDIPAGMGNRHGALEMPLPNVWLGVSTERQPEADERIPHLWLTPAAVRFISAEPLLGPIDLTQIPFVEDGGGPLHINVNALTAGCKTSEPWHLNWVIVGGESGPKARPMHPQWARDLRDQCRKAGVAFFFKQHGEWIAGAQASHMTDADLAEYPVVDLQTPGPNGGQLGNYCFKVGKKAAGRHLDGVLHDAMPQRRSI